MTIKILAQLKLNEIQIVLEVLLKKIDSTSTDNKMHQN